MVLAAAPLLLFAAACGGGEPPAAPAPRAATDPPAPLSPLPPLTGQEALRFRAHLDMAYRMYQEEAYDLALESLEAARQIRAEDPRLNFYMGHVYRRLNRLGPAEEALLRGVAGAPDRPEIRLELGLVYFDQFRHDRAVEELGRVLEADPGNREARYYLAIAEYRQKRWEEAARQLQALLADAPDHPEANYHLGMALFQMNRLPEAAAAFERELRIDPGHGPSHFNLAKVHRALGRPQEAVPHEREFRRLADEEYQRVRLIRQLSIHANHGLMHYDREEYRRAIEEFRMVLAERRDDAQIWAYLGSAHLALEEPGPALEALERARELRPNEGFTLTELGRVHMLRGDLAAAEASLREAIEKAPYLSAPHYFLAGLYRVQEKFAAADREMDAYRRLETAGGAPAEGWPR